MLKTKARRCKDELQPLTNGLLSLFVAFGKSIPKQSDRLLSDSGIDEINKLRTFVVPCPQQPFLQHLMHNAFQGQGLASDDPHGGNVSLVLQVSFSG